MTSDALAGSQHLGRLRKFAPRRLENQSQHIDLHCGSFKQREILKDIDSDTRLQRGREHRAADDVRSEMAHGQVERKSLARRRLVLQRQQMIVDRRLHGTEGVADAHMRKGRVNHGALALPALTIGDKNTVADQVLQRADHQIAFWKYPVGIAHDLAHRVGLVEQHSRASGVAQIANIEMIGSGGQQFEQIAVALPEHSSECDDGPQRERLGWNVKFRRCHLRFPTRCKQYGGGI